MKYFFIIFLLMVVTDIWSQSPLSNDRREETFEEDFIDPDSVNYEAYTKKTSSFKALFNGKPGRAILYGLVVPGGGQLYNKDYWKAPIAWALEGTAIGAFVVIRRSFNEIDDIYVRRVNGEDVNYRGVTDVESLFRFRRRFQKQSEQAGVAILVVHILVAVESYIDRHLSAFDINEDLSLHPVAPGILPGSSLSGVSVKYSF